jgi:hypothetical protein
MARGLSNPTVSVDDEVVAIEANSLSFNEGAGEMNVRTQSAGGGAIETVVTEDVSTKRAMVKFGLLATSRNLDLVTQWQERSRSLRGVVIRVSDLDFTRSFRGSRIINDPERSIGPEGRVEVEFNCNPAG